MSALDNVHQGEAVEVKFIEYSEDGPGGYSLMLTRADVGASQVLQDRNFGDGTLLMVTVMESVPFQTFYDFYRMSSHIEGEGTDTLRRFVERIKKDYDSWTMVGNNETYTQGQIEAFLGRS